MRKRSRWLSFFLDPEPPGLGLDLRPAEMSLVRIQSKRGKPEINLSASQPLPEGALAFRMLEPNILDRAALTHAVESLLLRSGASGAKRLALSLPDPLVRVSIVELQEAPRSSSETLDMLKFTLRKSLPFDVDDARIAFERLPASVSKEPRYLTGVMHEAVVSEYETLFADMGFHVGLILPSSLSLLHILESQAERSLAPGADYFFVNLEREYFSLTLVRDREAPVLSRTLGLRETEGPTVPYGEEDFLQEIIPTSIYYREKLGGSSLERVYVRSLRPDLGNARQILEEQFETPTEPFNLMSVLSSAADVDIDPALAERVAAAAGAAIGRAA